VHCKNCGPSLIEDSIEDKTKCRKFQFFPMVLISMLLPNLLFAQISNTSLKGSIKDFESYGFVLGGELSKIRCPNEITKENSCDKQCRIENSSVCIHYNDPIITDLRFSFPSGCNSEELKQLLEPHSLQDNNEWLELHETAPNFTSAQVSCNNNSSENQFTGIHFKFNEVYGTILNTINTTPPLNEKVYSFGKKVWFKGWATEKATFMVAENFCAKTYKDSTARIIESGTGLVGMANATVARQSNSKLISSKFVCHQKLETVFPEKKFSKLADDAEELNSGLPPSKQKNSDSIIKEFTAKLIAVGRKKVKCTYGFTRTTEESELSDDTYSIECQTKQLPTSQLCPKNSFPNLDHIDGKTTRTPAGPYITTLIYEASNECYEQDCYPGSFLLKNGYCGVCPKGTVFDTAETKAFHKKNPESLDETILCKKNN
jgi:hypothetical protein